MGALEPFNADQRQKIANLGLTALERIDAMDEDTLVLDAVLLVEVIDGDHYSVVHSFSTTERATVERGIVEQHRDSLTASFPVDVDPE